MIKINSKHNPQSADAVVEKGSHQLSSVGDCLFAMLYYKETEVSAKRLGQLPEGDE